MEVILYKCKSGKLFGVSLLTNNQEWNENYYRHMSCSGYGYMLKLPICNKNSWICCISAFYVVLSTIHWPPLLLKLKVMTMSRLESIASEFSQPQFNYCGMFDIYSTCHSPAWIRLLSSTVYNLVYAQITFWVVLQNKLCS